MQIKNKKGDIPTTILVLMIVLVCVLAIFSFIYSKTASKDYFVGIGLIETVKAFSEETSFNEKTEFSSDSGSLFESGNVRIALHSNNIEGNYSKSGFPLTGSKETVLVRVIYQR
ncbi:MAG: hypothetical protein Q8P15_03930 [Nanoarchaeota archaeon]|nr:hypothetical protein [Nanoarchaeota archaeon]